MTYVEIETGERLDGTIGYAVHHWRVEKEGRKVVSMEYLGEFERGGGFRADMDDDADVNRALDEARAAAVERLDEEYGKRGWRHV